MKIPFDPVCYSLNSISMGDVIAAAPVVKWAIEHLHRDNNYTVLAHPYYRDILHFIPDTHFRDFRVSHSFKKPYMIRYLNTLGRGSTEPRVTSMKMHLSTFASVQLTDRHIPLEELKYIPLKEVSLDHFNINFEKTVLIICTHRDAVRKWSKEIVDEIASDIISRGLTPVYIGKVDNDPVWKDSPFVESFKDIPEGIDLRNKTTIAEIASICRKAKAIVGVDSGPIHIAGTTEIPIVCGYTSVAPKHRIPLRTKGMIISVIPKIDCQFCQSDTNMNYHDYGTCYLNHTNCCKEITARKFILGLNQVLTSKP